MNKLMATGVALVAGLALVAGCGSSSKDGSTSTAGGTTSGTLSGEVVVLAASSLSDVFTELGDRLEAQNPDLTVTFSFAASSELAAQVNAGAPADVLATANAQTMGQVGALALDPVVFASNTLVIVTTSDAVTSLADLARPDVKVALCAEEVPCGSAAKKVLDAAGVDTSRVVTYGANVSATLQYVTSGEVDAAMVYVTDARTAGDAVRVVEVPEAASARNDDVISVLSDAKNPAAAQAFVDLVRSQTGRDALAAAGFALS